MIRFLLGVFLFLLILWYPWDYEITRNDECIQPPKYFWQSKKNWQGHAYFFMGDSHTYVLFNAWRDPWRAHRSIGYPAFLHLFLYPDHKKFTPIVARVNENGIAWLSGAKKPVYDFLTEAGLAEHFETAALVQRWLLAFSIALFFLSLCRWFSPWISIGAMTVALCLAPPPDPAYIMTEPLSCALTWFCGAFLLFAPKSRHQLVCFALASLCAALAYLVRPQMLSLTGLVSLVFLYQVFVWSRKVVTLAFLKVAIAFSPLLLAYGYIAWLSVTGGQLFLHTHPNMAFSSFCYFAETADAPHMPTDRSRKFTAWYGEHKEEFIRRLFNFNNEEGVEGKVLISDNDSPVLKRAVIGDTLSYLGGLQETLNHFQNEKGFGRLSLLERNILGRELNSGLWERHKGEMITLLWQNFICALGYYPDVWHLAYFHQASFVINLISLLFIVAAIIASAQTRWPLAIMTGIHIMAILSPVLGHFVLGRYVEPTEPFLLLAGMCALWILCGHGYARLKKGGGAEATGYV